MIKICMNRLNWIFRKSEKIKNCEKKTEVSKNVIVLIITELFSFHSSDLHIKNKAHVYEETKFHCLLGASLMRIKVCKWA